MQSELVGWYSITQLRAAFYTLLLLYVYCHSLLSFAYPGSAATAARNRNIWRGEIDREIRSPSNFYINRLMYSNSAVVRLSRFWTTHPLITIKPGMHHSGNKSCASGGSLLRPPSNALENAKF